MFLDLRITLFLARRSLLESPFPTALLIVSIAIGVAFQIPSTANLNGFRAELLSQSVDSGWGDVRVRPTRAAYIYDTSALIKKFSSHAYVTEATPVLGTLAEVRFRGIANNFTVLGVDPHARYQPYRVTSGRPLDGGKSAMLLGVSVARRLGVAVGDQVELRILLSSQPRLVLDDEGYGIYSMTVSGFVGFGASDQAFVTRAFLTEELGNEELASAVLLHTTDHAVASIVAADLAPNHPKLEIHSWMDYSPYLRSTVRAVETLARVAWLMGILAAGIPVLALLYINTLHRRRQIGLLSAMGFSHTDVFVLFLAQALLLAAAGTLLGGICALGLVRYLVAHPVFDWHSFVVRPVLSMRDLAMTLGIVLVTAVAAGTYPAWRAARLNPSKILRGIE